MGYGDEEAQIHNLYKSQGQLAEFKKLKPILTIKQALLSNAFSRLSLERETNQGVPVSIKEKDIRYYQEQHGSHFYPADLFVMAIHSIDSEYIKQQCEEIRRKVKKGK